MATEPRSKPSFSPYRRWGLGLHLGLLVLAVFSVVVMVNYLSRDYFLRLHVATHATEPLAPRTVRFLQSLTNRVNVTLYYDKDDPFYSTVVDLFERIPGGQSPALPPDRGLQARSGRRRSSSKPNTASWPRPMPRTSSSSIAKAGLNTSKATNWPSTRLNRWSGSRTVSFAANRSTFAGERAFTAALIYVTDPKPLKAYFLTGHGEHGIDDKSEDVGYLKLACLFGENCITNESLELLGTNQVPMDCNLLVVAGPTTALKDEELEKIDQYLSQGGRLLALFSVQSLNHGETGLEKVLAKWGVEVGHNIITDPERTLGSGRDVIVESFGNHQIVNPLLQSSLHMILPRSVGKLRSRPQAADAPRVEEIAFSGPKSFEEIPLPGLKSFVKSTTRPPQPYPLIVAVEKGAIKDVITGRGTTRMIIVGDSVFLANHMIDSAANRDFAGYAVNWLLDRPQLLEGIGPRPVKEYRLIMTKTQLQSTEWILLGALPGAALLLGSLVWLRRRR